MRKYLEKEITPLSKFPTEVIVYMFRKERHCETRLPWNYRTRYNNKTGKYEYWIPFSGSWTDTDGKTWNPVILGYTLMTGKEVHNKFTTTYGNWWDGWSYPDEGGWGKRISFEFEGMYWKGEVKDIIKELSTRPHVDIHGAKAFRKWKIEWKKSMKK